MGRNKPEQLSEVLKWLSALQRPTGEFQTKELYPLDFPEQGWVDGIPSPFITSSALISLMEVDRLRCNEIMQKGAAFIASKAEFGLWRFWDNQLALNKVPLDIDDTALCSFLLQQVTGKAPDNKKLLLANRNKEGLFFTWFLPRYNFLLRPALLLQLFRDKKESANTVTQQMLAPDDYELSIIANVLLYLGQTSQTQRSIDFVVDHMLHNKAYECHFYDEPAFTWYHISRAYKYEVKDFGQLKDAFLSFSKQRLSALVLPADLPLVAVLANSCFNFGLLENARQIGEMLAQADAQDFNHPFPYFTSKNRRYLAGSAGLTLSWYAEYLNNAITYFG